MIMYFLPTCTDNKIFFRNIFESLYFILNYYEINKEHQRTRPSINRKKKIKKLNSVKNLRTANVFC